MYYHLAIKPESTFMKMYCVLSALERDCSWRRLRDSNPRGVAAKRFSRPPRYDRFDKPPCSAIDTYEMRV